MEVAFSEFEPGAGSLVARAQGQCERAAGHRAKYSEFESDENQNLVIQTMLKTQKKTLNYHILNPHFCTLMLEQYMDKTIKKEREQRVSLKSQF